MKKCLVLMMLVCLSCSFASATNINYWKGGSGSWHDTSKWSLGTLPITNTNDAEYDYISRNLTSDSTVTISAGNAVSGKMVLGSSSDPGVYTLNVETGCKYTVSNYEQLGIGSHGVMNINGGTVSTWGFKFTNAEININDGGVLFNSTNWWSVETGTTVTINEGGIMSLNLLSGYTYGTGGNIDLCGGKFQIGGNKLTTMLGLAQSNFFTAYGDTDDSKLSITYDGSKTYVEAIPEPATLALLGLGGLLTLRRKK